MGSTNAPTRAHVHTPAPVAPNPADSEPKNVKAQASTDDEETGTVIATPTSRKEKRKQKKQNCTIELPTPPSSDTDSPQKQTPQNNPPRKKYTSPSSAITPSIPTAPMASRKAYPLLVCSIGNPGGTYANTLHSVGHSVLSHIASVKSYRPFAKGLSGLVARPDNTTYSFGIIQGFRRQDTPGPPEEDDWTFWQSTSLMNVSGKGVKKAWTEFERQIKGEGTQPRLVVVHDELESTLGKVSIREGTSSPKGHNGLKSCQASLGNIKWWRIGVGIGRPDSRDPNVVAKYVLSKMTASEARAIEKASIGVVDALRQISEGKR